MSTKKEKSRKKYSKSKGSETKLRLLSMWSNKGLMIKCSVFMTM